MRRLEGAYSVVALADGTLVAFRDPLGIRPLTLGQIGDDWVVASETCALDLVGADVVRDVLPGEVVWVDDGRAATRRRRCRAAAAPLCIFEHVYFARPDSALGGTGVHAARVRMGERLAEEAPVDADLVMPIPDSGTPAAIGFAKRSGIPFEEGPDQEPLRRPDVHPARPGAARAGDQAEVQPARRDRREAPRDRRRLDRARQHDARARPDAASRPAPPRCTSGSRRRRSSRRASTASTWPTRTSSPRRTARSRRCASTSARRSLHYLSLDGMQWATRRPGGVGLPRLLHAELPDARPGRRARREAPLRGCARPEASGPTGSAPGVLARADDRLAQAREAPFAGDGVSAGIRPAPTSSHIRHEGGALACEMIR